MLCVINVRRKNTRQSKQVVFIIFLLFLSACHRPLAYATCISFSDSTNTSDTDLRVVVFQVIRSSALWAGVNLRTQLCRGSHCINGARLLCPDSLRVIWSSEFDKLHHPFLSTSGADADALQPDARPGKENLISVVGHRQPHPRRMVVPRKCCQLPNASPNVAYDKSLMTMSFELSAYPSTFQFAVDKAVDTLSYIRN